jgi:hypothetical protein
MLNELNNDTAREHPYLNEILWRYFMQFEIASHSVHNSLQFINTGCLEFVVLGPVCESVGLDFVYRPLKHNLKFLGFT